MRVSPGVHVLPLLLHHGKTSGLALPPFKCLAVLGHGHPHSCLGPDKLMSMLELLDLLVLLLIVVLRRKLLFLVFVPVILEPGGARGGEEGGMTPLLPLHVS